MGALQTGQWKVLEMVATGASLPDVLGSIVTLIEEQATEMLCSILLFDEEHQSLHHGAACRLPSAYMRALDGVLIGPDVGSCGAAAFLRQRVVAEDIATHPNWAIYRELALGHGLRACWSTPILSPDRAVLGTFAMYYRTTRGPRPRETEWVALATHLAAIAIVRSHSERTIRASEARAQQLARLYSVSSSINEAIVRIRDVSKLYEFACRIAVEKGLAELAWIGTYDEAADRIVPVARFGADDGYVDSIVIRLRDPKATRGPGATAMRSGVASVSNDIATDPLFLWKGEAAARGLRACAAFPLRRGGMSVGVLFFYSSAAGFFGTEEERILGALADDISFAADSAENERQRGQAEAALRENAERLRVLNELGDVMRSVSDPDEVLRAALALLGHSLHASRCAYAAVDTDEDRCVVPYDYADGCPSMVGEYRLTQFGPEFGEALRRGGAPLVVNDISQAGFAPETVAGLHGLSIRAFVLCSLRRHGSLRALMAIHHTTPRTWTASEVATTQEFVERCWAAIEQRGTEARLRQSETLLRIAGRAAKLGGWSVRLPDLAVVWSDEVCVLHEVPIGTVPTIDEALAFYVPEYRATLKKSVDACSKDGTPFEHELEIVTAKERHVRVRVIGYAERAADGSIVGLQGAIQDVDDRRRLEEQLRQAQKMEALGQLAGGVAHDFNNLLSVILSYADLVCSEMTPEQPFLEDVEQIRTAGLRAASLTKQLLAFSRQQVVAFRTLNMNQIVRSSEALLRRLLGESIELATNADPALGCVTADAGQMEQVVMNLAVNARDAMPDGGKLLIATSNVVLDAKQARAMHGLAPGPYVLLEVADTGAGMSEETRARIFEPFFTTKERGKGTGLGLSTVFGIVIQSRGHIRVRSDKGKGTIFSVYLPSVGAVADEPETDGPASEVRPGHETVLLVEDDEQVRVLCRGVLQRGGYLVLEAANGRDALRLCEHYPSKIHLLLTDVVMPYMSGRLLAEQVTAHRPDIKVLFMSGYTDDAVLRHGVLTDGVAYLPKPLTPNALSRKVREVLSRA